MEFLSILLVKSILISFVSKVKVLLMRAWRERWSDYQWGVYFKLVVNSCNGDFKELLGQNLIIMFKIKVNKVVCFFLIQCIKLNFELVDKEIIFFLNWFYNLINNL